VRTASVSVPASVFFSSAIDEVTSDWTSSGSFSEFSERNFSVV